MKKTILITLFLLLCLFAFKSNGLAKICYVSDSFEITLRTGPSMDNKIIKMLSSGTKLQVLETRPAWLKVKTEDGRVGWIMKRYSMQEMPDKLVIKNLKEQIEQFKLAKEEARKKADKLNQENRQLKQKLESTQKNLQEIEQKYSSLKKDAEHITQIKNSYQSAKQNLKIATSKLQKLSKQNKELKSRQNMHWFMAGGGTVFLSALIGFVLGRIQRRKSKKVYF